MKKFFSLFLVAMAIMVLASCKKDPKVVVETIQIVEKNVEIGTTTVKINGTYAWRGKIDGIKVKVGHRNDLADGTVFDADIDLKDFSVLITGLNCATEYKYRYEVDYGMSTDYCTETQTFTTADFALPTVITATVSYVGHDNATCGGEVTDDGGSPVTARGVCWSQQPEPTLADNHSVDSCGMGRYESHITGLALNTKYYVRAYATNEKGTAYGNAMEFTTSA